MNAQRNKPPSKKRIATVLGLGIGFVLLFLGFPKLASLYTDYLWFGSIDQQGVFTTILWSKVTAGVITALVVSAVLYVNVAYADKAADGHTSMRLRDAEGIAQVDLGDMLPRLLRIGTVVVGLLTGLAASEYWDVYLLWQNASPFGVEDPIFGRDVSFYVFTLPLLEAVHGMLMWVVGLCVAASAAVHVAKGSIVLEGRPPEIKPVARQHLTILVAVLFLVFGLDAWIDQAKLLYSTLGPVNGASYADVTAKLPMLQALVITAGIGAVLLLASIRSTKYTLIFAAVGLYAAVAILGVRVYPNAVHRFSVLPNEAVKETPYIAHNIEATRAAYGIADVVERNLEGDSAISRVDIDNNRATVDNIRVWDHRPLLDTFGQIQEIRTYYEFTSVDNDRYMINGELSQTMLSPRELSAESLPNRTWINEHFTFTHGYGITLGPVNRATHEGLPELYIQDIPPVSALDGPRVTRPAIYFGEMTSNYVLVNTENREFDYPSGEDNVYAEYESDAGIPLDSFSTLVAASTRLNSLKLLLSDDITDETNLLLYRNIRDRVRRIAPFLVYDRDPYMVVRDNGELVWIQDAYTISTRYPYSERSANGVNYIRNSVKIVIDAYDGAVTFYLNDPDDPMIQSWASIFPDLFSPISDLPEDLNAHLRYPEDLFQLQTEIFTVYHMKRPELVYNREDQWEVPTVSGQNGQRTRMEPYYTIMRLPGEDSEAEFIQMLPFTPARKQNLAAWMVARMDGEHRGELVVYSFPKDSLIFGPQQIMNRINQNTTISQQISLWDQQGSEAILGTLLVIPIEEALIYVCPLYLRSEGGRIPELKRVIVVYDDDIHMARTLDLAIDATFGVRAPPSGPAGIDPATNQPAVEGQADSPATEGDQPATAEQAAVAPPSPESATELSADARVRASQLFERATAAQRRGDWAAYGEQLRELSTTLEELREAAATP